MKPDAFKAALLTVPPLERDAFVNRALGFDDVPDDGEDLPRDGVPYLPAPVDALLRFVELAKLHSSDVIVDVGSGVGRAAWVLHLLTGANVIGVEAQAGLHARATAPLPGPLPAPQGEGDLGASDLLPLRSGGRPGGGPTFIHHDAVTIFPPDATAYFLYCPFSGGTLARWLDALPPTRVRIGCLDVTLPSRPWLRTIATEASLTVYETAAR